MGSLLRRAALPASVSVLALAVWGIAASSFSSSMDAPLGETSDGHNRGSWTSEPCQFSYARFHLYLTIPPTIFLYFLNRPFLTRLDRAKLIFLPAIAFVWTTPWDNELVRQRAWRYPRSCVIGTVGYVPIEEYFFVSKRHAARSLRSTCDSHYLATWRICSSSFNPSRLHCSPLS